MSASDRRPVVAVFGSSTLREDEPAYAEVRELGAELAARGLAVMTGGYDGAMAAASRGANEAGGHVIGVTVDLFEKRGPVNPWVHERVHTPTIYARLDHLVREADAFVAVTGSIGTLTEIFIAWTMLAVSARPTAPLVLMGAHWREWIELHRGPGFIPAHLFRHVDGGGHAGRGRRAWSAGIAAR
ncbi:MAG: LOG family protein [Candidatus Eisenbacteria bacterium]|nr:LOG family protein [Candidatus Eisenbacteria bacterium]